MSIKTFINPNKTKNHEHIHISDMSGDVQGPVFLHVKKSALSCRQETKI